MFSITIELSPDLFIPARRGMVGANIETSKEQFIMLQLGFKGVQIELDYLGFANKTKHK